MCVFCTTDCFEMAVLRPYPRIIEPCGYRIGFLDLSRFILEQVHLCTVEDADVAICERGCMLACLYAAAGCLDTDQPYRFLFNEWVEHADGIAAASDACYYRIRQTAFTVHHLLPGLSADDRLQITDNLRERMRSERRAQNEVGVIDILHPVAECLVHRILQCAAPLVYADNPRTPKFHAEDIQFLPPHVLFPHKHHTIQVQQRTYSGGRHAVLAGTRLGNNLPLAHAAGQQRLSNCVVDLMGACMVQVLPLEIDLCTAAPFRQ